MGLFDGIVGNVLGSMLSDNQSDNPLGSVLSKLGGGNTAGGSPLLQIALSMLQQNGGLDEVLSKFRQGGMEQQANSWVSTGENMSISGEQVQQVFGSSAIGDMAAQLGMSHEEAGSTMAQVLPEVINHLTPQGQVPDNSNDLLSEGLSMLAKSGLFK